MYLSAVETIVSIGRVSSFNIALTKLSQFRLNTVTKVTQKVNLPHYQPYRHQL